MSPLKENHWRSLFVSKSSSPIQFDCLCPLPTCFRAAAETTSPPLQQREWRRCSPPLLLVLLHCAAPQADTARGGRCCTGTVPAAFVSKSPGTASLRISGEQFSAAAWEVPTAEVLNIQAKLGGLIQGWEIIKKECSLLSLPLSLTIIFQMAELCQKIQVVFETIFKCKCDISPTNHTFFRWR